MNWRSILRSLVGRDPNLTPRLCYSQDGEDLILDRLLDSAPPMAFLWMWEHIIRCGSQTHIFST